MLPPDKFLTGVSVDGVTTPYLSIRSFAYSLALFLSTNGPLLFLYVFKSKLLYILKWDTIKCFFKWNKSLYINTENSPRQITK